MAEIHIVLNADGIQTAWFKKEDADQQCLKSNKELESVNADLPDDQQIPLYTVQSVAIQDSTVLPYIAVYSEGGIIQTAVPRLNLDEAIQEMDEELYDNFDHETDDARIFDSHGNQVHSFDHEAMYEKLKKDDADATAETEDDDDSEDEESDSDELLL